ncbi:MAG: excinuclease ABC subunit UvrC [Candidatus Omnitrophota bacterium]
MKEELKKSARGFPDCPGIYIMKSAKGDIFYIGKANSLRKRVLSYFTQSNLPKNELLLKNVAAIDYIKCLSEAQALILEASLIKEKKPKYNISLRDDKSYPFIEVTREEFPRISIVRPKSKTKSILFGPYTKSKSVKAALDLIREVFPFRTCRRLPGQPCLYHHIGLCPGPCAGKIKVNDYRKAISSICGILQGERKKIVLSLRKEMKLLSSQKQFEQAALVRDKLNALDGLYRGRANQHELISLKELIGLKGVPLVIEAMDISSLGPKLAVGSLVVFRDGVPDKNSYRRFSIKGVKKIDDYAMIREVTARRYSRLKSEEKSMPDLIIVDGGKGHIETVRKQLAGINCNVKVIGIAKRNEELWLESKDEPLIIPGNSPSLHLIQRIRDEAHRFAHNYHLLRRKKRMYEK